MSRQYYLMEKSFTWIVVSEGDCEANVTAHATQAEAEGVAYTLLGINWQRDMGGVPMPDTFQEADDLHREQCDCITQWIEVRHLDLPDAIHLKS